LGDGAISAIELAVNGKAFQNAYGNGKVESAAKAPEPSANPELVEELGGGVPADGDEVF
jgi:hypothetical protein